MDDSTSEERAQRMHACLYSNDGRVELCERQIELEGLVVDSLSFALACVWHLNELAGCERMEPSSPATATFASLLNRARELGVPDV